MAGSCHSSRSPGTADPFHGPLNNEVVLHESIKRKRIDLIFMFGTIVFRITKDDDVYPSFTTDFAVVVRLSSPIDWFFFLGYPILTS